MNIDKFLRVLNSSATFNYSVDDEEGAYALDRLRDKIKSDKEFADKILKIINNKEK